MSTAPPSARILRYCDVLSVGATLITPNRRLARYLKGQYDAAQAHSGKSVWPSADVLPYGAFLERTWQELALAENGALLLSMPQEIALWESVIDSSAYAGLLLNASATARTVREAWVTQHAFAMDSAPHRAAWDALNDDVAAFSEWRRAYDERLRSAGWIDSAQLPQVIIGVLTRGARLRTRHLLRAGYETYTPQQQALFDALAQAGCVIETFEDDAPGATTKGGHAISAIACDDSEAELHSVAQQVRTKLMQHAATPGAPPCRIGVVVPDLAARRAAVIGVFDDILDPSRVVTPGSDTPRPFNCSLGLPLTSYPIVFTAFLILKLARGEVTLEEAGALLRSPCVGAAESEMAARARVDAYLRQRGRKRVAPGALWQAAQHIDGAARLAGLLEPWIAQAREARGLRQPPSAWSATFLSLLKGLGWPGERTLDSAEYQTFEKFRTVVSSLSALDALRARITQGEALSLLRRSAADTVFQPEANDAPVQILGTLESLGLSFDALFVLGLAGEAWPAAPRPNPFLPLALQRALPVPHATAEWELHFARRMTSAWRHAAPSVIFTWPQRDGERELTRSPLIDDVRVAADAAASNTPLSLRDALYAARAFEALDDWRAPPLGEGARVRGGAQLFQNQAACAFRAFAIHRLGATALDEGVDGLDARDRGTLVHRALWVLWEGLGSQAALLALDDTALQQHVAGAVNAAVDELCHARPDIMTDAFAALERKRLTDLLLRLTTLEKTRQPFSVVAPEKDRVVTLGGVQIKARPDRVDRLDDGSEIILDYKTGLAYPNGWLTERPDEPQLPLYAVSHAADVTGVAFVQLRAREVAFKGVTRDAGVLPEVAVLAKHKNFAAQYATWPALLASWRAVLEQLAHDYLAGRAEVAPKHYPATCGYCDLNALCRVRELQGREAIENEDGV